MPIGVRIRGPHPWPVVICDYCGEVIENARDGLYRWPQSMQEEEVAPMGFTHGACNTNFIETHGGMQAWVWHDLPLDWLPAFLMRSLKVSQTKVRSVINKIDSKE